MRVSVLNDLQRTQLEYYQYHIYTIVGRHAFQNSKFSTGGGGSGVAYNWNQGMQYNPIMSNPDTSIYFLCSEQFIIIVKMQCKHIAKIRLDRTKTAAAATPENRTPGTTTLIWKLAFPHYQLGNTLVSKLAFPHTPCCGLAFVPVVSRVMVS